MSQPAVRDLTLTRGDNLPLKFRLRVPLEGGGTGPLDLSNSDVLFEVQVPVSPTSTAKRVLFKRFYSLGQLSGDLAQGEVTWQPTPAESKLVPPSGAVYFLQRRADDPAGEWRTYLTGALVGAAGPLSPEPA